MHGSPYGLDMTPRFPRGCWGSPTFSSPLGTDDRAARSTFQHKAYTHPLLEELEVQSLSNPFIRSVNHLVHIQYCARKEDPMRIPACLPTYLNGNIDNEFRKKKMEKCPEMQISFFGRLWPAQVETFFTKRKHNWLLGNFHLFCTDCPRSLACHT